MRLIVFSDTHGNFHAAREVIERNQQVYTFLFLGDGEKEIDKLRIVYPEKQILNVSGNCDYNSYTPDSDLYNAGRIKVLFTHGHRFHVKYDIEELYQKGRAVGAQVILYGHTHERFYQYYKGIHMLNPGSAAQPRDGKPPCYAFVDITPSGILCCHVDLTD